MSGNIWKCLKVCMKVPTFPYAQICVSAPKYIFRLEFVVSQSAATAMKTTCGDAANARENLVRDAANARENLVRDVGIVLVTFILLGHLVLPRKVYMVSD